MHLKTIGKKVTLLFLSKQTSPFEGDVIVKLVKEPENPHDKNAIRIYHDGDAVGYLANDSTKTLLPGTLLATEVGEFIGKEAFARVDKSSFTKLGAYGFRYEAEVLLEEKVVEKKSEISFDIGGSTVTYPGRKSLQDTIGDKGVQQIKLIKMGDKIVAEFNGVESGFVKSNSLSQDDMDVLNQYLEDLPTGILAMAEKSKGASISCKIVLQAQAKVSTIDFDKAISRVIDEGILTEDEVNERLEYLKQCKVTKKVIATMFDTFVAYPSEVKSRIIKPKTLYVDNSGLVKKVLAYINKGYNLRFEGEKGVGKNTLAETILWLYNRPMWEFSSNSQHTNTSLIGKDTFKTETPEEKEAIAESFTEFMKAAFIPEDKQTDELISKLKVLGKKAMGSDKELVFLKSVIVEAAEYGGGLILDEFNSSLADVMTLLNALLDDRRRMDILGYGMVQAHKNFVAITTENKDYAGTFPMHGGTANRFRPIVFPQPDSIAGVLQSKLPNVNYDIVIQVNSFYNKLRSAIQDGVIGADCFNIRGFIAALDVLDQDIPLKEALIDNIANEATDINDREAIKDLIGLSFVD